MNKEIIAGIVFFSIWIIIMLVWGASKNIIPDLSSPYQEEYHCPNSGIGHPLDNCW